MTDTPHTLPAAVEAIQRDTIALGFDMPSEAKTGALLATLAATKPGGRFLEIGTGTGLSTAWLLDGMDADSHHANFTNSKNKKRPLGKISGPQCVVYRC